MNLSGSLMNNIIQVTPEALLPMVNKYFDRISAAEWTMLAAGVRNSATEATLADMLAEMVQTLTTSVLRIVVPILQERLLRSASPDELETYSTDLGDSLSETFAVVLQVQRENSASAEELTTLMEEEVSERIRSVLSAATNSTAWPSKPALYVSGRMSNISSLHSMVSHASQCLKGLLGKLNPRCLGLGLRPKTTKVTPSSGSGRMEEQNRCESSQSVTSEVCVPSMTKTMSDILQKWSSETVIYTEEAGTALLPLSASLEVHDAATQMVRSIIEDLHLDFGYDARYSERSSSRPHINVGLINKLRDFFTTRDAHTENATNAGQVVRKRTFPKFARVQFEKMMAELKSRFEDQDSNFIVSLKQESGSPRLTIVEEDEEAEREMLPGSVPETPRPESRSASRTTTFSMGKLPSPPVDFDAIESDVDSLFSKLHLKPGSNKLDNSMFTEEIRDFARDLTDKLYHHLMAGETYQIPIPVMGRSLSDSVISEHRWNMDALHLSFSPDVLYAMTEDAVGKFCQQMLLWLETEPSDKTIHHEEVSGALTEIDDLITRSLTPKEDTDIRSESPEASVKLTTTPCSICHEFPPSDIGQSDLCVSNDSDVGFKVLFHVDSRTLTSKKVPQRATTPVLDLVETDRFYIGIQPTSSEAPLSDKSGKVFSAETASTSSSSRKRLTSNLVSAVLMRLILRIPRYARETLKTKDVDAIIKRVSEKAEEEISIPVFGVKRVKDSIKKINKAVIGDILEEFDTPKHLVEALLASEDPSFDDALLKFLKSHLNTLLDPPPKKSKVARFFSAVGKVLATPFTLCIMGTRD